MEIEFDVVQLVRAWFLFQSVKFAKNYATELAIML